MITYLQQQKSTVTTGMKISDWNIIPVLKTTLTEMGKAKKVVTEISVPPRLIRWRVPAINHQVWYLESRLEMVWQWANTRQAARVTKPWLQAGPNGPVTSRHRPQPCNFQSSGPYVSGESVVVPDLPSTWGCDLRSVWICSWVGGARRLRQSNRHGEKEGSGFYGFCWK
jgi:hypothetical protein